MNNLEDIQQENEKLLAEVERLTPFDRELERVLQENGNLQSELTKARELFEAILDDPRLVVAMPSALLIPIKELLAHSADESCGQDAEAGKGGNNE